MSGFPILDLVIGMIFIFFMLSIISSSVVEVVMSYFKIRSKVLKQWLLTIFDKQMVQPNGTTSSLGHALMDHCLTTALSKGGKATSYMDAKNFVSALLEKVTFDPDQPHKVVTNLDDIIEGVKNAKAINGSSLLSTELQRAVLMYAYEAKESYAAATDKTVSDLQMFREKMEGWFDTSMERVSGSLKLRYARPLTFWIGLVVVVSLNADSIALARYLYSNPEARAKIAAQAVSTAKDTAMISRVERLAKGNNDTLAQKEVLNDIRQRELELKGDIAMLDDFIPLGWRKDEVTQLRKTPSLIFTKLAGWMATIMAVLLGAPFWFDLLNKIANLRGSGSKPTTPAAKEGK